MKLISHFMVAAIFSALLAGDSIAQQMDSNKTKQVVAAVPSTTGAASTAVNGSASENNIASEPSERERLLLERIEKLEQRLAGLESRSAPKPSDGARPGVATAETGAHSSPPLEQTSASGSNEASVSLSEQPGQQPPQPKAGVIRHEPTKTPEPFAFGDFTWLTGNPRTKESPFDTKVFTGEIRFDSAFHHSFNHPKDNTIGGSSEVFRSGEVQVTQIGVGGDFHYNNVRGRLMTQFGMYSQTTPRNDASPGRGQWNLDNAYRYISEAYGGYHIDKLNGINIDAGIFMSYVGLFSYYQFDNWAYQPSYVSSNTPWFFNGVRIQIFPSDKLKIEPWIVNGWQSYGKFNKAPGVGLQLLWRPNSSISVLGNQYWGTDTLGIPSRKRIHTDDSIQVTLIEGLNRRPEAIERVDVIEKLKRRLGESRTAINTADGSSGPNTLAVEASSSASSREDLPAQDELRAATPNSTDSGQNAASSKPSWHYGGFVDVGYLLDFNHPSNRLFRSRGTTLHVDNLFVNMAGAYARRAASEQSRWGVELTAHGGRDSEIFGFSATAPNIGGFEVLRHLGPTNVSYLAPVGKGLTVQGGIFASLIGYDSLYAKDNFNYTRPWGADFTPYLMMGVNASYPINDKLTGAVFVINGYWHLANANSVPSSGGQLAYKASPHVTLKETVLWGPHQSDTSFKYWRSLSDTIVERKGDRVTFAFEYIYSFERVVASGKPRALMMASQLPIHWTINKRWSATVRPEVFWDRDSRWTLARQTVKAITTTLEYRIPYKETNTILRVEHRWDDSRGPDGGFFRGAEVAPGVIGLTPTQHLLIFGLIFTFDR